MTHVARLAVIAAVVTPVMALGQIAAPGGGAERSASLKASEKVAASPPRRATPLDASLQSAAHGVISRLFGDPDAILRANAVEAAEKTRDPEAPNLVIKSLSDPAAVVRFSGCIACGNLGYADTRPQLRTLAYDPDPNVRLAARYGLHKLGDTSLSQEMILGLQDERAGVRANTALLLGMLGDRSAIAPLRHLKNDPAALVHIQVAESLWRLGDQDALEDLVTSTVSRYGSERVAGLLALVSRRDGQVMPHVRGLLVSDSPEVEITAARCAGTLGSDEGLGVALKYVDAEDHRQRAMCAQALGEIGRSDTQDALRKLMADPKPDVQLAAATAVLKLKAPATTDAR